ncbi:MAG: DinB family protein [Anaerolineae bacterium]
MPNNKSKLIDKMFEYNLWANTQLIELCSGLDDAQLDAEAEGVYGRIQPTLVHIVRAEGGYLNRVTGARPFPDNLDWDNMPMSDLLALAQKSGEQLVAIASKTDPDIRHEIEIQGNPYHFHNWTALLQALYHGIEHRTQIKFLLTQLGVSHPELAAWDFMGSLMA